MTSDTSNEYDLDWEPQTAGEALALQAAKHYRDGSVRQESLLDMIAMKERTMAASEQMSRPDSLGLTWTTVQFGGLDAETWRRAGNPAIADALDVAYKEILDAIQRAGPRTSARLPRRI